MPHETDAPPAKPPAETPAEELARLKTRVAELESSLLESSLGSGGPPAGSGNVAPLAIKLFASQLPLVVVSLFVAKWCNAGQLQASGWPELLYVSGLLTALAIPICGFAVNILIINLWATSLGARLLVGGTMAIITLVAIAVQWWLIEMKGLTTFACGALLMLFVPAMAFRLLTKWRLRLTGDPFSERHGAPKTLDLMLLTVVFAISITVIRQFFHAEDLELASGYLWWLSALNSLLPATAICIGCYASLRGLQSRNRLGWLLAAAGTQLLVGGLFFLQISTSGFNSLELLDNWPGIVSPSIDVSIIAISIAAPMWVVPILVGWPFLSHFPARAVNGPSNGS